MVNNMKYKINIATIIVIILLLFMLISLLIYSKWKDNMEEYNELPFGITDEEFEDIEEIEEVEDNNVWSFVKTLLWIRLSRV